MAVGTTSSCYCASCVLQHDPDVLRGRLLLRQDHDEPRLGAELSRQLLMHCRPRRRLTDPRDRLQQRRQWDDDWLAAANVGNREESPRDLRPIGSWWGARHATQKASMNTVTSPWKAERVQRFTPTARGIVRQVDGGTRSTHRRADERAEPERVESVQTHVRASRHVSDPPQRNLRMVPGVRVSAAHERPLVRQEEPPAAAPQTRVPLARHAPPRARQASSAHHSTGEAEQPSSSHAPGHTAHE